MRRISAYFRWLNPLSTLFPRALQRGCERLSVPPPFRLSCDLV